jgi:hypothetical protein
MGSMATIEEYRARFERLFQAEVAWPSEPRKWRVARPPAKVRQRGNHASVGYETPDGVWVELSRWELDGLSPEEAAEFEWVNRTTYEFTGRDHPATILERDGVGVEIDEAIATLIASLWARGISIRFSCQGEAPERQAYISFTTQADYTRFRRRVRERRPDLVEGINWDITRNHEIWGTACSVHFPPGMITDLEAVFAPRAPHGGGAACTAGDRGSDRG